MKSHILFHSKFMSIQQGWLETIDIGGWWRGWVIASLPNALPPTPYSQGAEKPVEGGGVGVGLAGACAAFSHDQRDVPRILPERGAFRHTPNFSMSSIKSVELEEGGANSSIPFVGFSIPSKISARMPHIRLLA